MASAEVRTAHGLPHPVPHKQRQVGTGWHPGQGVMSGSHCAPGLQYLPHFYLESLLTPFLESRCLAYLPTVLSTSGAQKMCIKLMSISAPVFTVSPPLSESLHVMGCISPTKTYPGPFSLPYASSSGTALWRPPPDRRCLPGTPPFPSPSSQVICLGTEGTSRDCPFPGMGQHVIPPALRPQRKGTPASAGLG